MRERENSSTSTEEKRRPGQQSSTVRVVSCRVVSRRVARRASRRDAHHCGCAREMAAAAVVVWVVMGRTYLVGSTARKHSAEVLG